ncbi:uncharacterized protein BX664DRAFT_335166 [Halteromyces radiatus]|uniref:uncharacterized protein n=1 Tax=Halteromyces radiatus TaxID=101107 RepID=UPI00221EBBC0|nr:uncharacterized protein BX664DRAFT_335166 [Halteromyces radiatus]KAI8086206.1 hypothetical protein BX664DRAFT_335166 [Halteromyces radiatus]
MKNLFSKRKTDDKTTTQDVLVNSADQMTSEQAVTTTIITKEEKIEMAEEEEKKTEVVTVEPSSSSPDPVKEDIIEPIDHHHHKPNKGRLIIRFWQVLAAVGAFAFQIGATPYSDVPFVFQSSNLQYYTYAIDLVSLLWALFMIFVYLTRRFGGRTGKVKRPIAFAVDIALAALFGVASFYQFAIYNCPPGQYNGWCHFHNTGKFFLLSLFLSYLIMTCWDLFGGCTCLRQKE